MGAIPHMTTTTPENEPILPKLLGKKLFLWSNKHQKKFISLASMSELRSTQKVHA